ncbi:hypothetical protein ACQKMD_18095 [Viridibacillus sp. NPDC096237]|uniref:hypothetical protein n=1 Tax=Viridibacillus sp. NPDC096237 TaxID=3390721 RepID=UPI003D003418
MLDIKPNNWGDFLCRNELITEIAVKEEPLIGSRISTFAAEDQNYSLVNVSQSTGTSYGKAYLNARLKVYSANSFRQINGIKETWWETVVAWLI